MRGLVIRAGEVCFDANLPAPRAPAAASSEASCDAAPAECRVQVLRAGICATDLALARGYMDFEGTPGHEFVGVALDGPLVGRRVVGEINAGCGRCARCRSHDARHCGSRTVLGILGRAGAFAEELLLPAANLHAVPDEVPTDHAVFAEPLAAAFEIPTQVPIPPGTRALVLGDGRLGLLCAQVLALHGAEVVLYGRHPGRADALPAAIVHGGSVPDAPPVAAARAELVVEATGDPAMLQRALALAEPRGTVVLKTTCERPATLDLAPLVVDEITLVGSRCGPFEPALAALAAGRVTVAPWIEARFPLEDGARAFARAARPGTLKVLLDVDPS